MSLLRGTVVRADIGADTPKPFLVVSNNQRNRALPSALVVRLTTMPKPAAPSVVECGPADPFVGRILCDDLLEILDEEVTAVLGAVTPGTMHRVEDGLRHALAL